MAYDVPVKLFSFHLIMLSLVLLAPDAKRLANVFLFNRPADPSPDPPLARSARGRPIALATQIALGAYLVAVNFYSASRQWVEYGGGAARSPLHGIWKVDEMWIDGQAGRKSLPWTIVVGSASSLILPGRCSNAWTGRLPPISRT